MSRTQTVLMRFVPIYFVRVHFVQMCFLITVCTMVSACGQTVARLQENRPIPTANQENNQTQELILHNRISNTSRTITHSSTILDIKNIIQAKTPVILKKPIKFTHRLTFVDIKGTTQFLYHESGFLKEENSQDQTIYKIDTIYIP